MQDCSADFGPDLLRTAILETLLERDHLRKPRPFDEGRFSDLLERLEKVTSRRSQPSPQTLDERWQFANCRVSRATYVRTGTVAHTGVNF